MIDNSWIYKSPRIFDWHYTTLYTVVAGILFASVIRMLQYSDIYIYCSYNCCCNNMPFYSCLLWNKILKDEYIMSIKSQEALMHIHVTCIINNKFNLNTVTINTNVKRFLNHHVCRVNNDILDQSAINYIDDIYNNKGSLQMYSNNNNKDINLLTTYSQRF